MTPAALLDRELRKDGARPFLTWYDDATGERVELSVATTANWVAKIANLLVDEFEVEPGATVRVLLPTHWETAMVLLATWATGGGVSFDPNGTGAAVMTVHARQEQAQPQLSSGDVLTLDLEPMGAGLSRLVGAQPDDFVPPVPVDVAVAALTVDGRSWSHAELSTAAEHAAVHHHLDASSRVLSTLPYDTVDGLDAGLLVPLAAGGSVVLVAAVDESRLAERCATERVTHTAGVTVAGLPRLDR